MLGLTQRGTLRWKEWVPLVTQQQRLRSLIQIIAYNIKTDEFPEKKERGVTLSYYYTLHLSSMSSPFYTSEKLESENPKWAEIEINKEIGAAPGVIMRLWAHSSLGEDYIITVWGVYLSGLVYLGPRLATTDPADLGPNSIIFHMHGGYFTSSHCFLDAHPVTPRTISVQLPLAQVKPSYSINLLLRLQGMQQAIARQGAAAAAIREELLVGVKHKSNISGGRALRKLLAQAQPPPRHQVVALNKQIESLKFKVQLLYAQRDATYSRVNSLRSFVMETSRANHIRGCQLMDKYYNLSKDVDKLKKYRQDTVELKSQLVHVSSLLDRRRKQLISQLSYIYPIREEKDGVFSILRVKLPDAESLVGEDDVRVSVALGFVAHLVHMISVFLNVPTRYPICHFGSRSKIIDHITDKIPDKDREFPLYRGKEKLLFDYGVYLLNKNIAQLRWCCGITTVDLKATLPNLLPLLSPNSQETARKESISRGNESSGGSGVSPSSDPQFYLRSWGTNCPDIPPAL